MTTVSKNVYIDELDEIVHKYNYAYTTIKMKLIDVKSSTYIDIDPKSQVGDHVRMSKYKNFFAKGYTPNWPKEVFVIKR